MMPRVLELVHHQEHEGCFRLNLLYFLYSWW